MAAGESKTGDYGEVLLQIVQRLITVIESANEATCFLGLDPDEFPTSPGDHVFVVAPVSGRFDEGAFGGAGIAALSTHSGCVVKIHCPNLIDDGSRDVTAITNESLGLIRKASAVISALAAFTQPAANSLPAAAWVPTLDSFNMTSPFRPVGYSLHKNDSGAVRAIELTFAFEFDWDTTSQ